MCLKFPQKPRNQPSFDYFGSIRSCCILVSSNPDAVEPMHHCCECVERRMERGAEFLLALGVIALTGCLSFAAILLVYRLCCHATKQQRLGMAASTSRDDLMLLGPSTPRGSRSDVKQLKRSTVRVESRGPGGLYAGVKALG